MRVDWGESYMRDASLEYYLRFVGGRRLCYADFDRGLDSETEVVVFYVQAVVENYLNVYERLQLGAGLPLLPVVVEVYRSKDFLGTLGVSW